MARAKQTERAEARRRHRLAQAELVSSPEDVDDPEVVATAAPAKARRRVLDSTPSTGAAPERPRPPSLTNSIRNAYRPVNLREDLAALPQIIRNRAVWIPVLATTAAGVLLVAFGSTNQLVNLVAQVFVVPPPMAASFLAGLLAPRASYLAGGIAGLWSAIVFTGVVFAIPGDAALQVSTTDRLGIALYAFVVAPLFGLFVGGFAGFYRRFLALSSPARRRGEQTRAAANRNRGTGRTASRPASSRR